IVATGLLAIGGILVMDQQMNIGQFVAAEIIILLIMSSVEKLILSFEIVYDVLTALEKIGQVTDLELENDSGSVMPGSAEEGVSIQVENASYAYPGAREKVLKDLSFSVSAGEKIMITGPSGSGKSTLLPVLAGLYDVQEGHVSYNGLPRGNLSSESLYSAVGDLFSHEQIFQGSVIENISINRPQATNEQVQWAVKHMGLEDFIRSCPQGYNTILAPEGKGLPRHIVTKLLLARSIAARPRLLLLETPFELLDLKDRESIIRFLTSPENPWTLLAISTDTLLAQHCHRILILEQGSVSQQGTYEELSHILNPITPGHA
ncbi:MAG: ATP-binding cassette domain-containing protein, partial [Owenweeksia sp.]